MELLVVDEYNSSAWDLHYTLLGQVDELVVLSLDRNSGHLNSDVLSIPNLLGVPRYSASPLELAYLPLPFGYEYEFRGGEVVILSTNRVVGRVHLLEGTRVVDYLEWFNGEGIPIKRSYYNNDGWVYRDDTISPKGEISSYLTKDGEVLYSINNSTGSVVMGTKTFPSVNEFYQHVVRNSGLDITSYSINSLGSPLFLVKDLPQLPLSVYWMEPLVDNKLPNNAVFIDKVWKSDLKFYFTDLKDYESYENSEGIVADIDFYSIRLNKLGNSAEVGNLVLVPTKTDQIDSFWKVADMLRDTKFTLVADTNFSDKLLARAKDYSNVTLRDRVSYTEFESLLQSHGVLLNIDNSVELYNCTRLAAQYGLVRFSHNCFSSRYSKELTPITSLVDWLGSISSLSDSTFRDYLTHFNSLLGYWV